MSKGLEDRAPALMASEAECPVIESWRWRQIGRLLDLTDRELQVVQFLCDLAPKHRIAVELDISEHTDHAHLGRIYRKLGVHGLPGLLLRVFAAYVSTDRKGDSSAQRQSTARMIGTVSSNGRSH